MRLSTIIISSVATAIAAPSPLVSAAPALEIVGHVVTNRGVIYNLTNLNEVKAFDDMVDDGKYPYPVDYSIKSGFHCIFYREATRGVGWPIGEYYGPVAGKFDEWIAFYKCFKAYNKDKLVVLRSLETEVNQGIPCGHTKTASGGAHDLSETTEDRTARFTIDGIWYDPASYHVSDGCTCRFYSIVDERGGDRLLGEYKGPADGGFASTAATYTCWTGA